MMSDTPDRYDLLLARQASLDRRLEAMAASSQSLSDSVQSLTRLFALQFRDVHQRLDGIDQRLSGMEQLVRGYASEQIMQANNIINAQQRAEQAHMRLDDVKAGE